MTRQKQDNPLTPEANRALDGLLAAWATRHALPAARVESIRQAILFTPDAPPTELTCAWWRRLFGAVATTVHQSNDVRRFLQLPA